jgi:hypothetical protein
VRRRTDSMDKFKTSPNALCRVSIYVLLLETVMACIYTLFISDMRDTLFPTPRHCRMLFMYRLFLHPVDSFVVLVFSNE